MDAGIRDYAIPGALAGTRKDALFIVGGGGGEGVAGGFGGVGPSIRRPRRSTPAGIFQGKVPTGVIISKAISMVARVPWSGQLDGFDDGVPEGLLPALQERRTVFGTQELGGAEAVARNQKAPVLLGPGAEGVGRRGPGQTRRRTLHCGGRQAGTASGDRGEAPPEGPSTGTPAATSAGGRTGTGTERVSCFTPGSYERQLVGK